MTFAKSVADIVRKLEKSFEKAADKAVTDPDDGSEAFHDARKVGEDSARSATDQANREVKNHDPAWKSVSLDHKVSDAIPKVTTGAKYAWAKFVGAVAAIFAGAIVFSSFQTSSPSPGEQIALDNIRYAEDTRAQIRSLNNIVLSTDDWNIMMGAILVPMAPAPSRDAAVSEAAPAPIPIEVAAVAAAPIEVEVETPAARQAFTSTVGQVYRNSPPAVQNAIEQHAIQHDYDTDDSAAFAQHLHEESEEWSRRNFPSNDNRPNNIHVDAVDGDGTRFGSADFHQ